VGQYQKGKINLDFTEARDSKWQWRQLGFKQVCISLQTDNHASTSPLTFLQAGCPSCRPTSSVKALKAIAGDQVSYNYPRQRLSSFYRGMVSGTAVNVIGSMNTKNSLAGVVLRQLSTTPQRSAAVKRHAQNVDLGILAC